MVVVGLPAISKGAMHSISVELTYKRGAGVPSNVTWTPATLVDIEFPLTMPGVCVTGPIPRPSRRTILPGAICSASVGDGTNGLAVRTLSMTIGAGEESIFAT